MDIGIKRTRGRGSRGPVRIRDEPLEGEYDPPWLGCERSSSNVLQEQHCGGVGFGNNQTPKDELINNFIILEAHIKPSTAKMVIGIHRNRGRGSRGPVRIRDEPLEGEYDPPWLGCERCSSPVLQEQHTCSVGVGSNLESVSVSKKK
jgi:hypothetical protein